MARPKKLDTPTKGRFVGFWISEELYQVVLIEAKKAGLSQSAYWRSLAANQEVRQQPVLIHNVDAIITELRQINKLGSNLNQIACHLNSGGAMTKETLRDVDKATSDIFDLKKEIIKLGGDLLGDP